jgi:Protein of unknown function (DUF4236)
VSILFRKRLRLGPFLAVNLSKSGLSWTAHLGPWSWNTRTRRHRVDLPGPLAWQEDRKPGERGAGWPIALAVLLTLGLLGAAALGAAWLYQHAAVSHLLT